ncbi:MAG: oligosaccharide flippase family protein [Theionarchaea archaeon]|nr:oligosaccharide flippase family protein [Theionarchaea archaeon]
MIRKIKKSDFFETLDHTKNYFLSNIAIKAIGLISIPIFTRMLTQEDYGIVAVFDAYVKIFIILLSLNAYTAVGRYFYENTEDYNKFLGTTLILLIIIFVVTIPLFVCSSSFLAQLLQLPEPLPSLLIVVCLFSIIREIYLQILIPRKKSKEVAFISIIKGYSTVVVAIILVYLLSENKYLGRIWANLIIGGILSVFFLMKIRSYFHLTFKKTHFTYIASYSIPLIPYALSGIILAQFDRIMINSMVDTASAGLYSLGYNIGMLLLLVVGATQKALIPDFYRFLETREYRRLDLLVRRVFSIITIVALGLVLFATELGMILADKKFHPGLTVVPIVVIGYIFYAMFTVYNRYISYEKKTLYLSAVVLLSGIINIGLNTWLIPLYGYIAAAYTTVISYGIMFLLTWMVAHTISTHEVTPLQMIWYPTLIMFLFVGVAILLNTIDINVLLFFMTKVVITMVFGMLIFWKEIQTLRKSVKKL